MTQFEAWRTKAQSTNPQESNERWWNEHPMAFNWDNAHLQKEGSREYFEEVDRRFFELIEHVAHPGWPQTLPFSKLEDFHKLAKKKVLEIGCGLGSVAEVLSRSGCQLTAIDLTQKAVELTRKRFAQIGLEATVLKMDAERMEFSDETFDYIWTWGVIHHSSNTEQIVREMHRVLRPGGRFAVMVYHKNSTRFWVTGVIRRGIFGLELLRKSINEIQMEFTDGYYARHYSRKEARKLFSNFVVDQIVTFDMADLAIPLSPFRKTLKALLGEKRYWEIVRFAESRFGWALFLKGHKPTV